MRNAQNAHFSLGQYIYIYFFTWTHKVIKTVTFGREFYDLKLLIHINVDTEIDDGIILDDSLGRKWWIEGG